MILDARLITTLQSCTRKLLLDADWEVLRFRPKELFTACLRIAIQSITNGTAIAEAAESAKSRFLQSAANPGLDLPRDANAYVIAKDYCAMIDTILHAVPHMGLPVLADSPVVPLLSTTQWQPLASVSPNGSLHRIITIDKWTEEDLARELHSWYVFGDICVTRSPLTLHVIEIGQTRNGRRASPWSRAWRHPSMPNLKTRFAHKDGTTFKGWIPVYYADSRESDAEKWVAQMEREGVLPSLIHHIPIAVPSESVIEDTLSQILQESRRATVLLSERRSSTWRGLPMSRGACDGMIPCTFQWACHQPVTDLSTIGLYRIRTDAKLTTV